MEQEEQLPTPPNSDIKQFTVAFLWEQYRTWALTARKLKKVLTKWKVRVFILALLGSFTAVLSDQLLFLGEGNVFSQIAGGISGLSVALSAYAGGEMLSQEREQQWLRSRSAAEAFKRESYLYLLDAPPYHLPNANERIFDRIDELVSQMADVPAATITPEAAVKGLPTQDLSVSDYVNHRVTDQVNSYYRPKTSDYLKILDRAKLASWLLGFVGVIMGTAAANGMNGNTVWIAFISATTASIAAFISTNKYEYMVLTYQAAANRLLMLSARYEQIDKADDEAQRHFVSEVEQIIAMENSSWVVEVTQSRKEEEPVKESV